MNFLLPQRRSKVRDTLNRMISERNRSLELEKASIDVTSRYHLLELSVMLSHMWSKTYLVIFGYVRDELEMEIWFGMKDASKQRVEAEPEHQRLGRRVVSPSADNFCVFCCVAILSSPVHVGRT